MVQLPVFAWPRLLFSLAACSVHDLQRSVAPPCPRDSLPPERRSRTTGRSCKCGRPSFALFWRGPRQECRRTRHNIWIAIKFLPYVIAEQAVGFQEQLEPDMLWCVCVCAHDGINSPLPLLLLSFFTPPNLPQQLPPLLTRENARERKPTRIHQASKRLLQNRRKESTLTRLILAVTSWSGQP